MMNKIILKLDNLVEEESGEIIGNVVPKFQEWKYGDYAKEYKENGEVRFLEPMTAQALVGDKLTTYLESTQVIAEQKFDGHRGLTYLTSKGNRMFSRRVSKVSGWYAENTDQMPHIRDIIVPQKLYGTVLDGEILLPIEDCTCRQVQGITGALPTTAIENQLENGFAYMSVFDILYYNHINIQNMPLYKRKVYLMRSLSAINSPYLLMSDMYMDKVTSEYLIGRWEEYAPDLDMRKYVIVVEDIEELFIQFLKEGKEGLIIKDIEGKYEQKRSKAFVKMKSQLTFDVVIMSYDEPTKEYTGKELETWEYFLGEVPVTKLYYNNWIGAVVFGVWKDGELVEVGRTSGMNEATRQYISENKEELIGKVIEVEAQCIINRDAGSLQHPRFICIREDKNSESCTFEEHIRNY